MGFKRKRVDGPTRLRGWWRLALVHAFTGNARRLGAEFCAGVRVTTLRERGDRIEGSQPRATRSPPMRSCSRRTPTPTTCCRTCQAARWCRPAVRLWPPSHCPHVAAPFGTNFDKEYGRSSLPARSSAAGFRRREEDEGLWHEEEQTTPAVQAGIGGCLTALFPTLGGVRIARRWAGVMGFTADGLPLIGRYPTRPGLTRAAGFHGNGFSWAAITGQIVADLLTGQPAAFDLTPFDPGRFATHGTAWQNPFTAGERSDSTGASVPTERP